jgi:hypothetical protein
VGLELVVKVAVKYDHEIFMSLLLFVYLNIGFYHC